MRKKFIKRRGFTLIEIMLVLAITGTIAGVLLPRMTFQFEPTSALLQRSFEEACDKALAGMSLRFLCKPIGTSGRGKIEVEALMKRKVQEDSLSAFLGTASNIDVLEWQSFKLANIPPGNNWKIDPEVIYFYSDGSCTPAKISWLEPNVPDSEAENYILTVTGYCVKVQ